MGIDLPDFPSRVSILKATLRKSPVDPSTDFEYLAEQTHGYSGADLHGISKVAAKLAIRSTIAKQVEKLKKIEAGEIEPEEADNDEDEVPMITMDMMRRALKESKRSVSPAEYQKYLSMKAQFDREAGIINDGQSGQSQPSSMHSQRPMSLHNNPIYWEAMTMTMIRTFMIKQFFKCFVLWFFDCIGFRNHVLPFFFFILRVKPNEIYLIKPNCLAFTCNVCHL